MNPEQIQLDQIQNGSLSTIIYFNIYQNVNLSPIIYLTWFIWNKWAWESRVEILIDIVIFVKLYLLLNDN